MPYLNEHSARLRDPGDFADGSFPRKNDGMIYARVKVPKDVSVVWGKLKGKAGRDDPVIPQALRFPTSGWTAERAKKWLADNKIKHIRFELASKPEASARPLQWLTGEGSVSLQAAASDGEDALPRLVIHAYSGAPVTVGHFGRVVLDLATMRAPTKTRPVLFEHSTSDPVGHTTEWRISDSGVDIAAVISGTGARAIEVERNAERGFPWQASLGARQWVEEFVSAGATVTVNGREIDGPIKVMRDVVLGEVSVLSLGADDATETKLAAEAAENVTGGMRMADEDKVVPEDKVIPEDIVETAAKPVALKTDAPLSPVDAMRAASADESDRIGAIAKACGDSQAELQAKAIREGWTAEKTELEVLRATRPVYHIAKGASKSDVSRKVLECVVRMNSSLPDDGLVKAYDEQTLDLAHKYRRMGIKALIEHTCRLSGADRPLLTDTVDTWIKAGFSTTDLAGILDDSANKIMLDAFRAVPQLGRQVARKLTAKDFNAHTGYRLGGDVIMKPLGAGGELEHGTLAESSFTYSVGTVGRFFGITRQAMINDDLGAFTQVPTMIGRGSALRLESDFWALVIANTDDFFAAANGNYIEGATTTLTEVGLDEAIAAMDELTDDQEEPILLTPKFLVVPPELRGAAERLYRGQTILPGTNDTPDVNIHAGRYAPISVPYLTAAAAWYLFGDPADVAAFGIAYLHGVESPVVEQVEQNPEYLGTAFRGYFDFGVCQCEPQGAVMSKGSA